MMPSRSDSTRRLTEAQVCEISGTSQQRRQQWVKRSWLRKATSAGCGLRDALELVQLKTLIEVLGPADGAIAWLQVREGLEQPFPADPLDVVFDSQTKEAAIVTGGTDLRAMIAHGRPIRVVALAAVRGQTAEAFRRVADLAPLPARGASDSGGGRRRSAE